MKNRTMMQFFEWYLPEDCAHWKRASLEAARLAGDGVNMVWLPPAYKGASGKYDVGYGVYDTYDLGEFDQKGSIPTKYGTKKEYLKAVSDLQKAGIEVLGDIVLNHRMGADLDLDNEEIKEELDLFGKWYLDMTKVDRFRLDAFCCRKREYPLHIFRRRSNYALSNCK